MSKRCPIPGCFWESGQVLNVEKVTWFLFFNVVSESNHLNVDLHTMVNFVNKLQQTMRQI